LIDPSFRAAQRHLQALDIENIDIGIGLEGGDAGTFFRKIVSRYALESLMSMLKSKNADHHHIYVRPANASNLVLIDDLTFEDEQRLADAGLEPACWVETSPRNFQAWIKLSTEPLTPEVLTRAAKQLARQFGGDTNAADWRHYGRLAGFTNRKPKYVVNGLYPFVLIHQWSGQQARGGSDFLAQLHLSEDRDNSQNDAVKPVSQLLKNSASSETFQRFARRILDENSHKPWASNPDWSRMDWMIGKDMMQAGFTQDAVYQAILEGSPNLSQRHVGEKRMQNYVQHTVKKIFSGEY